MCIDLEAAARNRKMVSEKKNIIGYQFMEAFIKAWPRNKPLPEWFSYGRLPTIDKSERGNLNSQGIYEIGNDGLLKFDKQKEWEDYENES